MTPISSYNPSGLVDDGLLPLPGMSWAYPFYNAAQFYNTDIAEPVSGVTWEDGGLLPPMNASLSSELSYNTNYTNGWPEMPQPEPYSPTVNAINYTDYLPSNAGIEKVNTDKIGWDDTFDGFGFNSTTLRGFGSVLSDISGQLGKKRSYASYVASYENQAQALRNQAEAAYKIAGINMSRMRGNQAKYLAQQQVSAVRTGFAPTSGSIAEVQKATMSQFEQQISDAWLEAEQRRQNTMYQASVADWRASEARKASKRSSGGFLGSMLGSAAGAYFGGPTGMAIGSKIGSSIGSLF